MKKLFLPALAACVMLAGCSKDATTPDVPNDYVKGQAFLGFSLSKAGASRANEEKPGDASESAIKSAKVLTFDEANTCLGVFNIDVTGLTVDGAPSAATKAIAVPATTKRVLVVVNPHADLNLTDAALKDKNWNTLSGTLSLDAAKIGNATDGFLMTNAGDITLGALANVVVVKPASESAADIKAAQDEAEANAKAINIDRVASKVTLGVNAAIETNGGVFTFQGWDINITNLKSKLYSDLVTYNGTTTTVAGRYRYDNNYLLTEQPALADMKKVFNYFSNDPLTPITKAKDASAYCTENTMEAIAQKLGYTTKVVVKAQYTPAGVTAASSYFLWTGNGKFYTLAELQAEYITHSAATGLKVDLPKFLKKAGVMAEAEADVDGAIAALTAADFDATTGIKGRYEAIQYFHESVCYYDVLIRHDSGVTTNMALGRYGVVRNNWYSLSIDKVTKPGTPWIPDPTDPTDPTDPDVDDDLGNAQLSVKITINPWTFWNQSVELN